ncbi:MAG TPA: PEP/pyruvate-binding domain-containing protein, partial [Anaerolineales bacterium]
NQADAYQNLLGLTRAIARIYASTLNPSALLYRRSRGLQDYDERMAILVQVVRGERFEKYFLPHAAGVAFSRNLYRWTPQIKREDGFVRMVWGLGTRAVDRVGNDYPRLVALSHPLLRPSTNPKMIQRYSQQYVDLIDLEANAFKTLPVSAVLNARYEPLRYVAQLYEPDGYFVSLRSNMINSEHGNLVVTFEELLKRTNFAETMRQMLQLLERSYRAPVDMEFTLHLQPTLGGNPGICIDILQCRPQSHLQDTEQVPLPTNLDPGKVIFSTNFIVPEGCIERVDTFLLVPPEAYFALPTDAARHDLARAIGKLNVTMAKESFVCIGPGRWGSTNSDLGVPIEYGDIYNARALIEVTGQGIGIGIAPEPSLGTHFFQDLLEAQIYPLAIYLDDPHSVYHREFFYNSPNHLTELLPGSAALQDTLRVVRVKDFAPGCHVKIVMSDEKSLAIAFIEKD